MKLALLTTDNRENNRDYAAPAPYFGTAPAGLLQGFAHLGGDIEVHVVSCTQQPVGAPEKLAPNIFFHSLVVPKLGWLRTGYQGCVRAVRARLHEIAPDIVHAQGTERDCAISAALSPYPRVLTIHGNMRLIARFFQAKPWTPLGLHALIEGFCLPRFDGVVCISRYTENAVRDLARRTWLLPNAADLAFYEIEPAPVSPPEVICVATIDARKNQNAFIDAVAPLAEKIDFRLRFFGATHPGSDYEREFLARLQKYPWCSHGGMIGRDELRAQFRRATALVLPTNEDNCPMTVLEAMASGLPVLASKVGGVPDLVDEETTGLFSDPRTPETMRRGLERLLTDSVLRQRLATAAREKAVRCFHPRAIATRHQEIYQEVLACRRPRS